MLRQRILSALVLAPPVLLATWWGGFAFALLVAAAAAIMCWEWHRIVAGGFAASGWAAAIPCALAAPAVLLMPAAAPALVAIGAALSWFAAKGEGSRKAWIAAGALYAGLPSVALVWLRADEAWGLATVVWLLLLVWATDIGAYAFGRLIGGPLLMPRVSPKKTWAGLLGGMLSAGLVGAGVAHWLGLAPIPVAAASALLAMVAQGGDLFESWVKRRHDVKDSSAIIPGHGGLLDRVDGLLAAALALAAAGWVGGGQALGWQG